MRCEKERTTATEQLYDTDTSPAMAAAGTFNYCNHKNGHEKLKKSKCTILKRKQAAEIKKIISVNPISGLVLIDKATKTSLKTNSAAAEQINKLTERNKLIVSK